LEAGVSAFETWRREGLAIFALHGLYAMLALHLGYPLAAGFLLGIMFSICLIIIRETMRHWADDINADSARAAERQVRGETIHSTDLA
jgi:hypothetical protein